MNIHGTIGFGETVFTQSKTRKKKRDRGKGKK